MTAATRPWSQPPDPDTITPHRPEWMRLAACYGLNDDTFYPEGRGAARDRAIARARAVCAGCPVRQQCEQAGAGERFGIWAGLDETDRGYDARGLLARGRKRVTA